MKKMFGLFFVLAICLLLRVDVFAAQNTIGMEIEKYGYYLNNYGVKIEKDVYDKIKDFYDEYDLEYMSVTSYNLFKKNLVEDDYQIGSVDNKYYETSYYVTKDGNVTNITNNLVSKDEYYENALLDTQESCGDACWKTEYKAVRLVDMYNGSKVQIMLENIWYKMPMIKKYDVIAMRWTGDFNLQNYTGTQQTNSSQGFISYVVGNSNYKTASNAIGLTMNLVNDATAITNILLLQGTCTGPVNFYGTYQHASNSNVTMAISKSYTFGASGLGGVLVFSNKTYRSYYDGMQGVSLTHNY